MTAFLSALGSKLADRWAAALLGPGLLFFGAVALGLRLGQRHALSFGRVNPWLTGLANDPAGRGAAAVLLAASVVAGASTAAGLAAAALGRLVERLISLDATRQPARALRDWRHDRWAAAQQRVQAEEDSLKALIAAWADKRPDAGPPPDRAPRLGEVIHRRDAICLVEPDHATWTADRLRVARIHVARTYDLDVDCAWPRLWSIAAAQLRSDIAAAQDAYRDAARLAGWAVLYLVLACWWWPAALIALLASATARLRARAAAGALADLIETTVDLNIRDLADRLGIAAKDVTSQELGRAISLRLSRTGDRR